MTRQATQDFLCRWYVYVRGGKKFVTWATTEEKAAQKAARKGHCVLDVRPAKPLLESSRG